MIFYLKIKLFHKLNFLVSLPTENNRCPLPSCTMPKIITNNSKKHQIQ